MFDAEDTMIGRGTPGTALKECFEARSVKVHAPFRKFHMAELPASINITNATIELCSLSGPHATTHSFKLALAIAKCIEEEQLLPGFSATIVAATSIKLAGISVPMRPMLTPYVLERLRIVPACIRTAYNHIWLQRSRLEEVIWSLGGDPALLPSPKLDNGEVDRTLFAKGTGLPEPSSPKDRTRPAFQSKGSRLRFVT